LEISYRNSISRIAQCFSPYSAFTNNALKFQLLLGELKL